MHSPEVDPGKPQNPGSQDPGISNPQVMVADLNATPLSRYVSPSIEPQWQRD
ncbi:hypothetical protein FOCG_01748 [Fusarium oxysporum f. sp. radicis-lycopersici 26381]|uniref:Uncharacterized protein n=1 Tax=Fusarium oxysporum Fo47 TaxID=660027 RepID=W9KNS2_FUSOX|nr:hypothetical protein FOZG_06236 [Fusarium oxysporum Fo47]EXL63412.1 hypothetical protein FOCG_01748 [Fusarium oxysporum f. sp. radicis-lycopersici 26381]